MIPRLTGKVAVVTGGGRGIGKGIARRLAVEGAHVVIAQRTSEGGEQTAEELRQESGVVSFVRCDIRSEDDVKHLMSSTRELYGTVDILVNNGGVSGTDGSVLDLPLEKWKLMVDTNLTSVFLCSQEASRIMVEAGAGGRIINIGSINSFRAQPSACHYVATKGAIPLLTMALAMDLSKYGILVNCVAPGAITTERTGPRLANPEYRAMIQRSVPLGRTGAINEVASVVAFLASDEASYIQGETISVDGGILAFLRLD